MRSKTSSWGPEAERTSSVSAAPPGMTLMSPGDAVMLPTVPTTPGAARASASSSTTISAAVTTASERSSIGVPPA